MNGGFESNGGSEFKTTGGFVLEIVPFCLEEYTVRPPLYAVVRGTGFFAEKPRIMGVRVKWGFHKYGVMGR